MRPVGCESGVLLAISRRRRLLANARDSSAGERGIYKKIYFILDSAEDSDLRQIAGDLNDLRDKRNTADYDMRNGPIQSPKTVRLLVERALRAITRFDDLCADDLRMATPVRR